VLSARHASRGGVLDDWDQFPDEDATGKGLPVPDEGTAGCLCRDCMTKKLYLQATIASAKD